jgi:predicted RNase H-related nuclease YkuK (DUF458 family)
MSSTIFITLISFFFHKMIGIGTKWCGNKELVLHAKTHRQKIFHILSPSLAFARHTRPLCHGLNPC